MKIAFIGLGVMGYPIAGHLQAAGHSVTVYNRTTSVAQAWVLEQGGQFAITPYEATQHADIALLCVGNDDDVRSVVLGDTGMLAGLSAGTLLIDHTTTSAELAKELAHASASKGVSFLDAPVSGGQIGAQKGQLTIMVGGDVAGYQRAEPVLQLYAKQVQRMGDVGMGQMAKMVNQICIAGLVQALAEGVHFAQAAGLDVPSLIDVLKHGAAQSWQMENRAVSMSEQRFDFGFALDWMRKDLNICLEQADKMGVNLPVTALVDRFYAQLQQQGEGRCDTSALIKCLA